MTPPPHAHPLEYIWLIVTTTGCLVAWSSERAAERDWHSMLAVSNGNKHALVKAIKTSAIWMLGIHALLWAMSLVAFTMSPPPPTPSTQGLIVIGGATLVSAALTGYSIYGRVVRTLLAGGFYERHRRAGDGNGQSTVVVAATTGPSVADAVRAVADAIDDDDSTLHPADDGQKRRTSD